MSFDISTIKVADTFEMPVINPKTGEPWVIDGQISQDEDGNPVIIGGKALSITFHGPATKEFRAADHAQQSKLVKRFTSKGKTEGETEDETAARVAGRLADITVSLNNFDYKGLPNGRETFLALYKDPNFGWLVAQSQAATNDWGNAIAD